MHHCAIVFQIITFWNYGIIHLSFKDSLAHARLAVKQLNYVSIKYGHEVNTWATTLRKCEEVSAKEHLKILGYYIEFKGDGKVCNLTNE